MQEIFETDQTYTGINFAETPLPKGEYDGCQFTNCEFGNANLTAVRFTDCSFTGCNLSLASLAKTAFQDIVFKDCKMLGLRFDQCSGFGLSFRFDNCILHHSSFFGTKIKGTVFKNAQLQETDFTDADLSGAVFDNCDLARAVFENTLLLKADFRTAFHYSIDPEKVRLKGARFSLPEVIGLLDKYDIRIEKAG